VNLWDFGLLHTLMFLCEVDFVRDDNEKSTAEKSITEEFGVLVERSVMVSSLEVVMLLNTILLVGTSCG
jgi:hypothetical protein